MPTSPPAVTAAPTPYPVRNDRATFSTRVDAFVTWLVAAIAQLVALVTNAYNNAVDAYASANTASAAAASAIAATGAIAWVTGTNYVIGDGRYSPLDFQSYRRITNGAGAIDPSLDTVNWALVGSSTSAGETIMNYNLFGGL